MSTESLTAGFRTSLDVAKTGLVKTGFTTSLSEVPLGRVHLPNLLGGEVEGYLREAARLPLDRIRSDLSLACAKIRPLLCHLRQNIFDPNLNVSQMKRACGVRDNSIATLFNATVGIPPAAYIASRRFETASNLLRDTRLPVWRIGKLVGYSSMQSFSRAFARWSGQRPNAFRKGASRGSVGGRRALPSADSMGSRSPASSSSGDPDASDGGLWLSPEGSEAIPEEEIWKVLRSLP